MTKIEDYEDLIKIASNPDTMPEALATILKNLKADAEEYASLDEANRELNGRIKTLQDTNTKLLLSQVRTKQEEPEEEEKKALSIEEFSHNL